MDAPIAQASFDLGLAALKVTFGIAVGLLGAILWNHESRIQGCETARLTKDDVKDAVKSVLHDDEVTTRKHR